MGLCSAEHSWLLSTTFACFVVGLCTMGVYRGSSGIIYVEILTVRDTDRELAAWPISLAAAAYALSGIVGGVLLQFFSIRQVAMSGILFCTFGLILCFLSDAMPAVIIGYGLLLGTGVGLTMISLSSFVNTRERSYRATINGIFKSSASLGVILLPFLVEWMINNYALNGTMLLLAALTLQSLVFGLLIRPFPKISVILNSNPVMELESMSSGCESANHTSTYLFPEKEDFSIKYSKNSVHSNLIETSNNENLDSKKESKQYLCPPNYTEALFTVSTPNSVTETTSPSARFFKFSDTDDIRTLVEIPLTPMLIQNTRPKGNYKPIRKDTIYDRLLEVLKNLMFHIITFSYVTYTFMPLTFNVVVVDFGMDRSMSKDKSILLLSISAIAELIGRSGFGWITDKGFMTRKRFMILCDILLAVILFTFTFAWNHELLFFLSGSFGALNGCAFSTIHAMYADYLRPEVLSISMGMGQGFNILAFLARPAAIGLFRDVLGSYDGLFGAMAVLTLLSAVAWILDPVHRTDTGKELTKSATSYLAEHNPFKAEKHFGEAELPETRFYHN